MDRERALLLDLFAAGLAAVDARARTRDALAGAAVPTWVLAAGKAAPAMALGARDALGDRLVRALVVSREDHFDPALASDPRIACLSAGHPVPDERSVAAGRAALAFAAAVPAGARVAFLVSGGASSLLEVPAEGVDLAALRRFNAWALASGRPIEEVNAIRRRLSAVKGGRLLARLAHADVVGLAVSDVPGDDPAVIGSGLLAAPAADPLPEGLPGWLSALLAQAVAPPAPGGVGRARIVACLDDALEAVARAARERGLAVTRASRRLEGDAAAAAARAVETLRSMPAGLYLAGGETTVRLPAAPGRGGRNQHLALAAALDLDGEDGLLLLAVGTDGTDGNSPDAGALVDGTTARRARELGLDPREHLARADSGTLLAETGDLVHTGPTGTNVGDLLLGLRRAPGHGPGSARGGKIPA